MFAFHIPDSYFTIRLHANSWIAFDTKPCPAPACFQPQPAQEDLESLGAEEMVSQLKAHSRGIAESAFWEQRANQLATAMHVRGCHQGLFGSVVADVCSEAVRGAVP